MSQERPRFSPPELSDPENLISVFPELKNSHSPKKYSPLTFSEAHSQPPTHRNINAEAIESPADELSQVREQAQQEGYRDGYERGLATAKAEQLRYLETWKSSVEEVLQLRGALHQYYRNELGELALKIAEAVLQQQLQNSSEPLERLIQQGLKILGTTDSMQVQVSKEDYFKLAEWIDRLKTNGVDINISEDPSLSLGDIKLFTQDAAIEAVMKDRLARVRALVLGDEIF